MKQILILLFCLFLTASSQNQPLKTNLDKKLELARANPTTSIFTQSDWYIWGADVIKVADQYYMYYSRWPKETGMAGWLTHSEIALATATSASGPFTFQTTVFTATNTTSWDGGMVHSPQILEYQDKYYLYYTGVPKKPENLQGAEARQYLKDKRRLGVAFAEEPQGPWQRLDEPLIATQSAGDLDSLATANPAILETPEGNFLLIYKGIKQEAEEQRISLLAATSETPLGPFETQTQPILDNNIHVEDPDIWYQNDNYFMIAHDVTGYYSKASDGRSLALFTSSDGLNWQATTQPLASRRHIRWNTGSTTESNNDTITYFQRFERPHILVEDNKATMLYVAVKEGDALSYNVAVPVELK